MYPTIEALLEAYQNGERPSLRYSPHALKRGVDMARQLDLDPAEIRHAAESPDSFYIYRDPKTKEPRGVNLRRARICLGLVLDEGGWPVVATILWTRAGDWAQGTNAYAPKGREYRELS